MSRLAFISMAILCLSQIAALPVMPGGGYFVYIGTQSTAAGSGISLAHFDPDTGELTRPQLILAADGPSFFAASPKLDLYSTNYTGAGGVSAYKIDRDTGGLTLLNRITGGNFGTSHISADQKGQFVFAANFDHGHIAEFPIRPDGSLAEPTTQDLHTGSSINPVRQKGTYPHCVTVDPGNRFVLVPDLGLDKMFVYRFDDRTGAIAASDPPFVDVKPGSGPRHVCFSPNRRWAYLINEMGSTINVYEFGEYSGRLSELQSISTLGADFQGENTAAEIAVHPNGRFVYASNRGENTIAVFAVDPSTGILRPIEHIPSRGKTPRDFVMDMTGNWLICTNQDSDNVVVFRVDPDTGLLTAFGKPISVPAPCGLRLVLNPVMAAQAGQ
jgi:6-phosphogluconolactonase